MCFPFVGRNVLPERDFTLKELPMGLRVRKGLKITQMQRPEPSQETGSQE